MPTLKTQKGVKVLNIKLPRTPSLPTDLGGVLTPGTIYGLLGVTWKLTPQQKPAHYSPRAKYLRGWGGCLSPAEVLRSNLLQPLVTRTKCTWGSCQHLLPTS